MRLRRIRRRRGRPPWWFTPVVMAGVGATAVILGLIMQPGIE